MSFITSKLKSMRKVDGPQVRAILLFQALEFISKLY